MMQDATMKTIRTTALMIAGAFALSACSGGSGADVQQNVMELFGLMAQIHKDRRG